MPVYVEGWVIGDHGDPPRVGRTEQYVLAFLESPADGDPGEPGVLAWNVVAEPLYEGQRQQLVHVDGTVVREYHEVLLHGDGWAASWCSPRPVVPGPIRVRGSLFWTWPTWGRRETRLRGRVERVQVVTKVVDTSAADPAAWSAVVGGWRTRDVAESPLTFERGDELPSAGPGQVEQARHPNPWTTEIGVLVTLDPARAAPLMPDAIAAHGDSLWVADRDRPLVVRVERPRDPAPRVTVFSWDPAPGGPGAGDPGAQHRQLHADAAGCWVTDSTGIRRLDTTGDPGASSTSAAVRLVDTSPISARARGGAPARTAAVASDGTLAVAVPAEHAATRAAGAGEPCGGVLRLYRPGGGVDDVALPAAGTEPVAAAEGFVLQLGTFRRRLVDGRWARVIGAPDFGLRLGRVELDGTVGAGPRRELSGTLTGPDPLLLHGGSQDSPPRLYRVSPEHLDLEAGPVLPCSAIVWSRAGRVFAAGQLPTPYEVASDEHTDWWPLPGAPAQPERDGHHWFAELDPDTLEPVVTAFLPRLPRHLEVAADGTVWVQADHRVQGGRVHYLPPGHPDATPAPSLDLTGSTPVTLDPDSRLEPDLQVQQARATADGDLS